MESKRETKWVKYNQTLLSGAKVEQNMATHVHKKMDERTVQRFINELQTEEAHIINWKCGPYMRNAKVKKVSITHWAKNWTLMLQGPEWEENILNGKLQEIQRQEREDHPNENENPNRLPRLVQRAQTDWANDSNMGRNAPIEDILIKRTQIEDILRFARRWENASTHFEEERTGNEDREEELQLALRQHGESAHVMRENQVINKFKCEILVYMQQNGLVQGKGKGEKGCARKPMQWASESRDQVE